MLVMVFSWFYFMFGFLLICLMVGLKNNFGQLSIICIFRKCGFYRIELVCKIEINISKIINNEVINLNENVFEKLLLERYDDVIFFLFENLDCVQFFI